MYNKDLMKGINNKELVYTAPISEEKRIGADNVMEYLKTLTPTGYIAMLNATIDGILDNSVSTVVLGQELEYKKKIMAIQAILSI